MTFRLRPSVRPARRTHLDAEERQQFLVTVGFLLVIGAAILLLGGAVALGYYNDHLKPVATVNGTGITQDAWIERTRIELFRIQQDEARVREAVAAGELDPTQASRQQSDLEGRQQSAPGIAIEDLIDLTFLEGIGSERGISVTDADVDAAIAEEAAGSERRRVQMIAITPKLVGNAPVPTGEAVAEAEQKAQDALAELESGTTFGQVAVDFNTDPSSGSGQLGAITEEYPLEPLFREAVFALEEPGNTGVVEGTDGTYRIGRVNEILPARADPSYQQDIEQATGLASYRSAVRRELVRDRLKAQIEEEAQASPVEQLALSEIAAFTQGLQQDATEVEEVGRVWHILYSPYDDPQGAAEVNPDDPAWIAGQAAAQLSADQLKAISDLDDREARFRELAMEESDDAGDPAVPDDGSAGRGGDLGWVPRSVYVPEFADPIFDGDHERGDIIGPVKSAFGWHVILYQTTFQEMVDAIKADPDTFADFAERYSDAKAAADGGAVGWVTQYLVDPDVWTRIKDLQPGQLSELVTLEDGYHLYQVTDRESRDLDERQRALIGLEAFDRWYAPQKQAAEDAGQITRDQEALGGDAGATDDFGNVLDPGAGLEEDPGGGFEEDPGVLPPDPAEENAP
jgi:parvulin-like peptidyl-prolyl isomerase